jgi:predicted phosphoribosyltransferase
MEQLSTMHKLLGSGGVIRKDLLRGRTIILVSDGLRSPFSLDMAIEYLKPIEYTKLVIATPIAGVEVVDHMHVLADDLDVLTVIDSTLETDHYYDQNDIPSHEKIIEIIEKIIFNWK